MANKPKSRGAVTRPVRWNYHRGPPELFHLVFPGSLSCIRTTTPDHSTINGQVQDLHHLQPLFSTVNSMTWMTLSWTYCNITLCTNPKSQWLIMKKQSTIAVMIPNWTRGYHGSLGILGHIHTYVYIYIYAYMELYSFQKLLIFNNCVTILNGLPFLLYTDCTLYTITSSYVIYMLCIWPFCINLW